ncbi:MAG: hypothetical protein IJU47_04915 [Verrucomicrobia bacterium]|nr:hypothetical protein [Verrucomicrobiota bacterium]
MKNIKGKLLGIILFLIIGFFVCHILILILPTQFLCNEVIQYGKTPLDSPLLKTTHDFLRKSEKIAETFGSNLQINYQKSEVNLTGDDSHGKSTYIISGSKNNGTVCVYWNWKKLNYFVLVNDRQNSKEYGLSVSDGKLHLTFSGNSFEVRKGGLSKSVSKFSKKNPGIEIKKVEYLQEGTDPILLFDEK